MSAMGQYVKLLWCSCVLLIYGQLEEGVKCKVII